MKGMLTFDLQEEQEDFEIAVKAMSWALVAWDMDQALRAWLKYGHKLKTADEALEKARDRLHEILDEHGVNLDMIS